MLLAVSRLFIFYFLKLSPCSIQLQGKKIGEKNFFFGPSHKLAPFAQAPDFLSFTAVTFFYFFSSQNHDMLVLFSSFLSSGVVFPLSGPPWISAAFLHCTVQQQSPHGRERNALKRLGTDKEQARRRILNVCCSLHLKTRSRMSLTEKQLS